MTGTVAAAQLASDQVPHERVVPDRQQIQNDMEESPFRLGPFRLQSRLVLRNSGYDSNVFGASENPTDTWTAQVGAGVHGVLPLGGKAFFVADALPGYVWFSRIPNRNTLGGFYRGAVEAFFNHLSGEVAVYQSRSPQILSSETEVEVLQKLSDGSARLELAMTRAISVFGSVEVQEIRNSAAADETSPIFEETARLDRRDTAGRAGVRYRVSEGFDVSAAIEQTRTSFVVDPEGRDNTSRAYLGGIHYDRPRFYINVSGGYRKGGGLCNCGDAFPGYATGTGSYFASWLAWNHMELQAWGHRGVSYSVFESGPYYIESRAGGGPSFHLATRFTLRAFGEYGTNAYPAATDVEGSGSVVRRDRVTSFGGGASYAAFRNGAFGVAATKTRYDSNISTFNRSVFRVTAGVTYDGEIPR